MDLALRVISCLVQTGTPYIEIGGGKDKPLEPYGDSDWAGCQDTRRSTTGYISFFLGSPFNWTSKRSERIVMHTFTAFGGMLP